MIKRDVGDSIAAAARDDMALQKILVDQMGVLTLGLKTQIGQNILATG